MITHGKKWHYLAVKKLFALFIGIKPKHKGDYYCLIFFICTEHKISLKSIIMCATFMIIVM